MGKFWPEDSAGDKSRPWCSYNYSPDCSKNWSVSFSELNICRFFLVVLTTFTEGVLGRKIYFPLLFSLTASYLCMHTTNVAFEAWFYTQPGNISVLCEWKGKRAQLLPWQGVEGQTEALAVFVWDTAVTRPQNHKVKPTIYELLQLLLR